MELRENNEIKCMVDSNRWLPLTQRTIHGSAQMTTCVTTTTTTKPLDGFNTIAQNTMAVLVVDGCIINECPQSPNPKSQTRQSPDQTPEHQTGSQ